MRREWLLSSTLVVLNSIQDLVNALLTYLVVLNSIQDPAIHRVNARCFHEMEVLECRVLQAELC